MTGKFLRNKDTSSLSNVCLYLIPEKLKNSYLYDTKSYEDGFHRDIQRIFQQFCYVSNYSHQKMAPKIILMVEKSLSVQINLTLNNNRSKWLCPKIAKFQQHQTTKAASNGTQCSKGRLHQ